jgi:translocation and assembly module TamA
MYCLPLRSALAAIAVVLCAPAFAQVPPSPAQDDPLASPEFDPLTPIGEIPDIEDDWRDVFTAPTAQDVEADSGIAGGLKYSFDLAPLSGLKVTDEFKMFSELYAGRGKAAASLAELHRRAREDTDLLRRLLRAQGYYDPDVLIEVDPAAENDVLQILMTIDPGQLYRIDRIDIRIDDENRRPLVEKTLGLAVNDPVDAKAINAALDRVKLGLTQQGFPFAKIEGPEIIVDHDKQTASYALSVDLGPSSRFGEILVSDGSMFSAEHIARLARFKAGDAYDSNQLEDLRRALIATGLVSTVSMTLQRRPATTAEDTVVDIKVELTPAPLRTLAGLIGYSTTDGILFGGTWQHRNLLPPQGQVTFRGIVGTEEQRISAELRRANWKARDRILGARVEASIEDRSAYYARSVDLTAYVERETNIIWQKKWYFRVGAELLASEERDRSDETPNYETFLVVAAPVQLNYDGSDDLLDPKTGFRLTGRVSPELSLQDGAFGYTRTQIEGSGYLPVMGDKLVLAGRASIGTIFGADRSRIAPSRRFYAGGGGSVRGYGYQDIGPRDDDNDPLGGRSITEFSIEARYRFGDFGVVPFLDGGQIDTSVYPRFKDLQFGAGIGARYHTSFGPIRFDIATPLNPRKGDPVIAVYVSIGQAF